MIQAMRTREPGDLEMIEALWASYGWRALTGLLDAEVSRVMDMLVTGQETSLERIGWMRGRVAALRELMGLPDAVARERETNGREAK